MNPGLLANQAALEPQERQVVQEKEGLMVSWVCLAVPEVLVPKDPPDQQEVLDLLVTEDLGVKPDLKDHEDPLDLQELLDRKDLKALWVKMGKLEITETRVTQDGQVYQAWMDQRDHQEILAHGDHQDLQALRDLMVREDNLVQMVKMDQRDHLDQLDHVDLLVRMDEGDPRETQEDQDHLDHLVSLCMDLPFKDGLMEEARVKIATREMHLIMMMHGRLLKPWNRLQRKL